MSRPRRRFALAVAALFLFAAVVPSESVECQPHELNCLTGRSDEVNEDDGLQDSADLERKRRSSVPASPLDDNFLPTARAVPSGDIVVQDVAGAREPRLNIVNNRQNLATKVMSNGVEVIVAGDRKPSLLAHEVIQSTETISPSAPVTLAPSAIQNQVAVATDIENVHLLSSIQSDPAQFSAHTHLTTLTYLTTLLDGNSTVVSKRQEVITNVVTRETGSDVKPTIAPDVTLTAGFLNPNYQTLKLLTTFTYFNTFTDGSRPVTLTSRETISNMVTVPDSGSIAASPEILLDTNTYFRTYTFSKTLNDQVVTTREVVTQIVVTEAPKIAIEPTPIPEGTAAIEPTPLIEGSKTEILEDEDIPLVATKTFFTTSTLFTTLLEGTNTVVVSRTQVVSSIATETITGGLDLFTKSLLAAKPEQIVPSISELEATEALVGTDEASAEETPLVKASIVTSTTVIPGIDGTSSTVVPGATVIMVTNTAGEVIILPTEVLTVEPTESSTTQSSGDSPAEKGGIAALLSSLGLSALRQGLASNNKGGLNLGTVIDAMSGIISNSLANRRNDSSPARITAPEQPVPLREPQFIPISGSEPFIPAQNPQGRTPIQTNVVPPAQRLPGQVPVRRPEPGVPLVPAAPGSPLLRPGATFFEDQRPPQPTNQFGVIQVIPGRPLTQLPGQPVPIQINVNPPVQTGFTGIPNIPIPVPTRVQPAPGNRPLPPPPAVIPPFVPGKNNIDRVEIQPTVPLNVPPSSTQFFAANGQPILAPPLPPGPLPQRPVESLPQGSIVPGPDGVPVRIIAVPEGQRPPPGAEGHVFIRPAVAPLPPPPRPQLEPPRADRPQVQPKPVPQPPIVEIVPSRREDSLLLSTERPVLPSFQLPAVQTIASIEGDNKIVRTRIISNGQTLDIEPTETMVTRVIEQPSAVAVDIESTVVATEIEPTAVAETTVVIPTAVTETTIAIPSTTTTTTSTTGAVVPTTESIENGSEAVEVVGNVLQPTVSQPPQIEGTLTVTDEASPEATPEVIQTTPRLETSSVEPLNEPVSETPTTVVSESSTVVEKATAIFDGLPESVIPELLEKSTEAFGITSVVMGPEEVFTTFVTRAEEPSQTVVSTIVGQVTEVNSVTPTATIEVSPEQVEEEGTSQMNKFTQEPERPASPTFPPESPFNPPTQAPATFKSTTTSTTTTTTPLPVSKTVQEETSDNKFVVAGIGGQFGVNQPATSTECNCGNFEVCQGSICVCRPGYSRPEAGQPCRKSYAYQLSLVLERVNDTMLHYDENLSNSVSPQYRSLASAAKDGLHQALMNSEISDKVFSSEVMAIHPVTKMNPVMDGVLVDFFVQLAEQHDEEVLTNQLMKSLEATNYSLGDSQIFAARFTDSLQAQDFDECSHAEYNDCSEFATCVNEKGSYKCQCNPGFVDSSDDTGRICLAELKDCEKCNRNGRCVFDPESNQMGCVCNYWFAGKECQINLKVLMIVILAVGSFVILFVLALIIICCLRSRRAKGAISAGPSFLRYRGPSGPTSGTLDRTAMIRGDTSSESSGGAGADNFGATSTLENGNKAAGPALQSYRPYGEGMMIPRVKTHHSPANKASAAERGEAAKREQQLIEYLESKRRSSEGAMDKASSADNLNKSRSSEALAATGRSSVSSLSKFRSRTISEVRSYDETTIRPAVRRPSKYYQSDDSDNNSNFDSF